ncbi:hypothetical protein M9Y10_009531 [Tritrichomonas musculus]|uniref:Transmembrane 9 superfamily member n=1 Tax=Tritrichomonas musculus TaxID=1915356 RepID=A0ABR2INM5_9EUKA
MIALFISFSISLYLPGNLPNDFNLHDRINLSINALRSSIRPIPLDYFKNDVFCTGLKESDLRTNIGEFLSGDALHISPLFFHVGDDEKCTELCRKQYNSLQKNFLINIIENKYRSVYILDDIPVSFLYHSSESIIRENSSLNNQVRSPGVEIGYTSENGHFLYNHINFLVKYTKIKEDDLDSLSNGDNSKDKQKDNKYRIVGFDITSAESYSEGCQFSEKKSIEDSDSLVFTYSVHFEETNVSWNKRWNEILTIDYSPKYHWISLFNTLLILLMMTFLIIFIFFRMIKKDFLTKGINDNFDLQSPLEETGWQLIHGDVFRSPNHSDQLCNIVGSGSQLLIGSLIVLVIAALGFLAPLNMGSMITTIAVAFIIGAPFGGCIASRLLNTISQENNWKKNIVKSGIFFILPSLILYFIVNQVFKANESSAVLTWKSFFDLIFLIGVIDLSLFFLGSFIGIHLDPIKFPIRVNNIPRKIPKQPWFLSPFFTSIVGGLTVFSVYFVDVFFIYRSLWTNLSYYYLFGLLFIVFVSMIIVSAEISICFVYLHLLYENYNWWWAAFRIPASTGLALFFYSIFYMVNVYKPPDMSSIIIYLIFTAIFGFALALTNGSAGLLFSLLFVKKIYSLLKME